MIWDAAMLGLGALAAFQGLTGAYLGASGMHAMSRIASGHAMILGSTALAGSGAGPWAAVMLASSEDARRANTKERNRVVSALLITLGFAAMNVLRDLAEDQWRAWTVCMVAMAGVAFVCGTRMVSTPARERRACADTIRNAMARMEHARWSGEEESPGATDEHTMVFGEAVHEDPEQARALAWIALENRVRHGRETLIVEARITGTPVPQGWASIVYATVANERWLPGKPGISTLGTQTGKTVRYEGRGPNVTIATELAMTGLRSTTRRSATRIESVRVRFEDPVLEDGEHVHRVVAQGLVPGTRQSQ